MAITGEVRQRRRRFAAYLREAMRAAGFIRPNGDLDIPALHRMSGVPDSILRRWLNEAGDPSLENLRPVARALGIEMRALVAASELMSAKELGLEGPPELPPRPPSPEERIMADDVLSDEDKSSLIHNYRAMRERRALAEESRHRKRS